MKDLEPRLTKLRVYLTGQHQNLNDEVLRKFPQEFMDVCQTFSNNEGSIVLEIVARRVNIHQRVVPLVEELFPQAFVTMEAVCGDCIDRLWPF